MSRLAALFRTGWYGFGTAVHAVAQWGIICYLVKFASPTEVGRFTLGLAIAAPVFGLTGLQLRSYLATSVGSLDRFYACFGLRLASTAVAVAVVCSIAFLFILDHATRMVVIAVAIAKSVESISDLTYGVFQRRAAMQTVSISMMARAILGSVILVCVTAISTLFWGIVAMAVASSLVVAFYDLRKVGDAAWPQLGRESFVIARRTWPMGLTVITSVLLLTVPRYFLQLHHGEESVGIYSALFYVVTATTLFAMILVHANSAALADAYRDARAMYHRRVRTVGAIVVAFAGAVVAMGLALGDSVIAWLYSPAYSAHSGVFHVLLLAAVPAALWCVVDYNLIVSRQLTARLINNTFGVVATLVASAAFVPKNGLAGAGWAFLLGSVAVLSGALLASYFKRIRASSSQPGPRHRLKTGIPLFVVVLLFSLGGAELFLRAADVSHVYLHEPCNLLGFRSPPGAAGWYTREGRGYVRINQEGWRDRDHAVDKPASTFRLLVLGDSFIEALQVDWERSFSPLLERGLRESQAREKEVEVITMAKSGFNTSQEVLSLKHFGWRYDPDIVLLAFYPGNDLSDNQPELSRIANRPFHNEFNGDLLLDDRFTSSPAHERHQGVLHRAMRALLLRSRLAQLVVETGIRLRIKRQLAARGHGLAAGLDEEALSEPRTEAWRGAWATTERLLIELHRDVRRHDAQLVVVTLPLGRAVLPHAQVRRDFLHERGLADFSYAERRVAALGDRIGFTVIALTALMREHAEETGTFLHGFDGSGVGHWNEVGHSVAAGIVASSLCEELLSPCAAVTPRVGK